MPTITQQCFMLLGCVAAVYIGARLLIKGIYCGTCFAIAKLGERRHDQE